MNDSEEFALCYVGNIPPFYHAKHLRMFFSTYVEMKAFHTFHFRHRPERRSTHIVSLPKAVSKNSKSNCAFIKVYRKHLAKFLDNYKERHWLHRNGFDSLRASCIISEIKSMKGKQLFHFTLLLFFVYFLSFSYVSIIGFIDLMGLVSNLCSRAYFLRSTVNRTTKSFIL